MRVAVIDVGSNTARLLVVEQGRRGTSPVANGKAFLGLGEEILEHGEVREPKLDELSQELRRFARLARESGAVRTDVFLTAPGRQAENAVELVGVVARATGQVARILSPEEEGELAYEGAVASTDVGGRSVAVCDVGGGSTELAIGEPDGSATWVRSIDVGSLRLTAAMLHDDPPTKEQLAAAQEHVREQLDALKAPSATVALAVGGSARALARLVGEPLSVEALSEAVGIASSLTSDKLARRDDIDTARARTLAGGALILREVSRTLRVPLQLGRGGLREGAAARLLQERAAA